jgi:hypothetical protein
MKPEESGKLERIPDVVQRGRVGGSICAYLQPNPGGAAALELRLGIAVVLDVFTGIDCPWNTRFHRCRELFRRRHRSGK